MTAGPPVETTVAASQTLNLRESVNVTSGAGLPVIVAAKVGKVTIHEEMVAAKLSRAAGRSAKTGDDHYVTHNQRPVSDSGQGAK